MCGSSRCSRSRFLFPVVLAVILVLTASQTTVAECPVNTVYVRGEDCCDGEVVFNLSASSAAPANEISYGKSWADYDLSRGRLRASAWVKEANEHRSGVTATDVFTLTGVPAAMIKIHAALSYAAVTDPAGRMAWVSGYARLQVGDLSVETSGTYPLVERSIELEVIVLEGEPFAVTCQIEAAGWGYYPTIDMGCTVSFPDLPAGAEITSCNGFGETEVPVEETTWGAVKTLYR
jgi:hypothetical protein